MSKDIQEAIERLNSIIKVNNDYLKDIEKQTINQTEIQALETALNYIETLEKENEELTENYSVLEKVYITNSIPTEVIKEKIKDLENKYIEIISKYDDYKQGKAIINVDNATNRAILDRVSNSIDILQDLLENK